MRPQSRLWETLMSAAVMALATAIAAACFVRAAGLSRQAYAQDLGLGRVQAAADVLSASGGDLDAVSDFFGAGSVRDGVLRICLDGGMDVCGGDAGEYVLSCGPVDFSGGVGTCPVSLSRADGTEVFSVTASWQEVPYGHEK